MKKQDRSERPLVSAIITTKNAARTLDACLRSIRNQSFEPIEIIVVDNASADATLEIAAAHADLVVTYGPERSAQRNEGLRRSCGRYALFLDADMILEPGVVASCVQEMQAGARAVTIPEMSFGVGFWSRCKALERSFYRNDREVTAARFFEAPLVHQIGGYDEQMTGPEDWDLSMRVLGGHDSAFCAASIQHDEGVQTLANLYLKKFYYGKTIHIFVRKHSKEAIRKLSPLRPALLSNLHSIFANPLLGCGLVIMKTAELAGILHGVVSGRSRGVSALYRAER